MSQDCMNTKIENALKDKDIVKIMNKASKTFTNQLDHDAIYTCQINALWKAFKNFKPEKQTKFTTYLYHGVFIECIKEIKFINKSKQCKKKLHDNIATRDNTSFLVDLMDEIETEEEKELILDKISNMTIDEMAKKRNSNRETTRKKLKKAISKLSKNFS
jgi:DNA-directed RNA polymerase specialized sigma24 family protein